MELAAGATCADALKAALSGKAYKACVAARAGDALLDLTAPVPAAVAEGAVILEPVSLDSPDGLEILRHSVAHVMACAVQRLFPKARVTIGPAIEKGFYYDFDAPRPFSVEDFPAIEAEMRHIAKDAVPFTRSEMSKEDAIRFFEEKGESYKAEIIREIEADTVSLYHLAEFTDLCRGPHLPHAGFVKAATLLSVAGAYWRGDEKNKMLQRIYGISFPSKELLAEHLERIEEAKKRDHRKLGRELDLFDIYDEGPGFPFFMPKGMVLRNVLENYWRDEHARNGYDEVKTPIILNEDLWHRSGHWDHYQKNMYFVKIDEGDYAVKPMNCPGGMLAYARKMHSYRDLPQRMAELGLVHRHELSGALHGLMRVRCFTQDDAHIFMTPEQIEAEVLGVIKMIDEFYKVFGFEYHVELSTRPEDSMGSAETWDMATEALRNALNSVGKEYVINEGDGAFYGPKIDFHLKDCLGRTWQCGTIQLDFQMPERFDLTYIGSDGEKHRPVMIHRVVFGSIERFIAILTEHYAGAFPLWLAPVQIKVLPISSERHLDYATEVYDKLRDLGFRVELDGRNEKIGYKIREAQMQKNPYMLVVGDKEAEDKTVAVRSRDKGDMGVSSLDELVSNLRDEIERKAHA